MFHVIHLTVINVIILYSIRTLSVLMPIFIVSNFSVNYCCGQNLKIDSLTSLLSTNPSDTVRVNALNELGRMIVFQNPDSAITLGLEALFLSEKNGYLQGVGISSLNLGIYHNILGDHSSSLKYIFKALETFIRLRDIKKVSASLGNLGIVFSESGKYSKALEYFLLINKIDEKLLKDAIRMSDFNLARKCRFGISSTYGNIGNIFKNQGDYPKALEYYFRALKTANDIGDKTGIANHSGNIGNVFAEQKDYYNALRYYFKALEVNKEMDNIHGIAIKYGNIGNIYSATGDLKKALEYYFKALNIHKDMGDKNSFAVVLGNIGLVYFKQKQYDLASDYYIRALKTDRELGDRKSMAINLINIGDLFITTGRFPEAEENLLNAYRISDSIGVVGIVAGAEESLSRLFDTTGRYLSAYEHYKRYNALKDSLFNESKSKEIGKLEAKYEYDKQQAIAEAEHKKEIELAAEREKRQRIFIYLIAATEEYYRYSEKNG
ncbi:MAG: tetratricopeptide repeat protein [Bacteroidetes bacterium]|nr:tetratricopeptide repeat protein [Bacteroidota bacterium]